MILKSQLIQGEQHEFDHNERSADDNDAVVILKALGRTKLRLRYCGRKYCGMVHFVVTVGVVVAVTYFKSNIKGVDEGHTERKTEPGTRELRRENIFKKAKRLK